MGKNNTDFSYQEIVVDDIIFRLYIYEILTSTNQFALDSSLDIYSIIIANKQLKGKGRQGRTWISDNEGNLYFTIVLDNNENIRTLFRLNIITAYALCDTIKDVYSVNVNVKWPNDILYNGKKISGILLEAKMEGNKLNRIVLGVGINLNADKIADEIKNRATTLFLETGEKIDKLEFLKRFLRHFIKWKNWDGDIDKLWDKYSAYYNKEISFHYNNSIEKFIEKGITDDGALIIEDKKGVLKKVYYGEIGYDFGN